MTLEKPQYFEILDLILNGKSYREVSGMMDISKNTPYNLIKRLRTTGSILPATTKVSPYDPIIRAISERIHYYLLLKKNSYNRKKVKLTNKEIYILILAEGYMISVTKFKQILRLEKNKNKDSYLHIAHVPGEVVQFDWGHTRIKIGGKDQRIYFAVFTLPYSNYCKAYVTSKQDGQSFVNVYKKFIKDIKGIPPVLLIDNMKIAKVHKSKTIKEEKLTTLFKTISDHYGFEVRFCTPYRPNQKGNVENGVKIIKSLFDNYYISSFDTITELQDFINIRIIDLNNKMHPSKNDTCRNLMHHEKKEFFKIPAKEYIYYHECRRKVSRNNMISFNYNKYEVNECYKGEYVTVRYNENILYILSDTEVILGKYNLKPSKTKSNKYRVWYILNKLKTKSEGFINSEEYKSLPSWLKKLFNKTFHRQTSDFISFLQLLEGKPKDTVKYCLSRNKLTYNELTIDILLNHLLL